MFGVIKLCHLTSRSRAVVTAELSPARTTEQTETAAKRETVQLELIISNVLDPFIKNKKNILK